MTLDELAKSLKPGDEITTTQGRSIVIGAVHADGGWWIEPQGADGFTWWIPLANVVRVNGQPVQSSSIRMTRVDAQRDQLDRRLNRIVTYIGFTLLTLCAAALAVFLWWVNSGHGT